MYRNQYMETRWVTIKTVTIEQTIARSSSGQMPRADRALVRLNESGKRDSKGKYIDVVA